MQHLRRGSLGDPTETCKAIQEPSTNRCDKNIEIVSSIGWWIFFQILCDLHFSDRVLAEGSDFMQQLRNFKPQSLGCAVARRKSSTTLIFPLPLQACSGRQFSLGHMGCEPYIFSKTLQKLAYIGVIYLVKFNRF